MLEKIQFSDTVMGKITKDALMNWNGLSEQEAKDKVEELGSADKANNEVTYGSQISSIEGIAQILGLSKDEIEIMTSDINTKTAVSEELANKVKTKMEERGLNISIIDVLSVIHDNWVQGNGNKFEDPKRMGKLYQFVDLKLLDFEEAKADLLFLKPILEGSGITVDEIALQQEFLHEQKEFLEENGIKNKEDLQKRLGQGAEFYPALKGVTTTKGKTAEPELITDRLQDSLILEKMTDQVAEKAKVQEKESTVKMDQIEEIAESEKISKLNDTTKDIKESELGKDNKEQGRE